MDFFAGSGTTGAVAAKLGRKFIMVDENPESIATIKKRIPESTLDSQVTYITLEEKSA
jgi:site-specific DNA-methyltransferase (adenine-specific)